MTKEIKKTNFENVWKFIKQSDTLFGVFMFRDPTVKKTKFEKYLATTWPSHIILVYFFLISTLFVKNFALINIIFNLAIVSITCLLYFILVKMIRNKKVFLGFLTWCENLYDTGKSFPIRAQGAADLHLVSVERRTVKMLKWIRNMMFVDSLCSILGFVLIGMLLPDDIYPKFYLPAPFYLPFKEPNSWHAFIITVLLQLKVAIDTVPLICLCFGTFFCIALHILGYLDIIKMVIEEIKGEMLMNLEEFELEANSNTPKSNRIIQVQPKKDEKETVVKDDKWIINIVDMLSNVNSVIHSFSNFYSEFFFLLEISCLGSLFMCGLIFTIIKQQYAFAIGGTFIVILLFFICYINEKILDGLKDIKEALYDIPWYKLDQKQKKILLIAMNCDNIQRGFTAAGIHDLTLERFGIVVKAGYTNVLILKDLISK